MGIYLENLKEQYTPLVLTWISRIWFSGTERRKFWHKLATQLHYNLPLVLALDMYRAQLVEKNSPLELVFDSIVSSILDGQSLDIAFGGFIPEEESMLIRAGIASGNLSGTLRLCAELIKSKQSIVSSLVTALAYPCFLLAMFLVVLIMLSLYVVPQLALLGDPAQWTGAAYALYITANFVASFGGALLLGIFIGGFLLSLYSLSRWTGAFRVRFEHLPPWSFYRLINGSVWMFTVATLMQAGLTFQQILDDMLQNPMSDWLFERVTAIRQEYQHGTKLATALSATGFNFPDKELVTDLRVYESLPGFHDHLYALSKEWLDAGTQRVATQTKVLNLGLISGIVALLCLLAFSVTSLQQNITTNMGGF